jgi:hypothetical protein
MRSEGLSMTGLTLNVQPLDTSSSFRTLAYNALKQAITAFGVAGSRVR